MFQKHILFVFVSQIYMNFFSVSIFMKGEQMIPILNAIGVHAAVFGNHDFGKKMTRLNVLISHDEVLSDILINNL